jgi:DinB superfamily
MKLTAQQRSEYLARYEASPRNFRAAYLAVPPSARHWRPAPQAWSVQEVLGHCADSETYSGIRIRLLLGEEQPLIVGYDENRWAKTFDYGSLDPELAFSAIEIAHRLTLDLLRRLPDSAFGRQGTHTQSGPYSDADWFRIYAEHLEVHTRQIERIYAAWRARQE